MTPRARTIALVGIASVAVLGAIALLRVPAGDTDRVDSEPQGASGPSSGGRRDRAAGSIPESDPPPVDPRIAHVPTDLIAATLRRPLVVTGVVEEASGAPPEQVGASCRLGFDRSDEPSLCRVVLECGHSRLHGDPILHDTRCGLDDAGALVLMDDASTHQGDGDPSLSLDGDALTVRDDRRGEYGDYVLVVRLHSTTPGAPGAL